MKQLERHSATGLLDKYLDYLQLVGLVAHTVSINKWRKWPGFRRETPNIPVVK